MSSSHLGIPRNETVHCAASLISKKKFNILCPTSYTHISVIDLCIFRIGLSILLQPNIKGLILGIYKSFTDTLTDFGGTIPFLGIHKLDLRLDWIMNRPSLQRNSTENLKRIFPEMKLRSLIPYSEAEQFHFLKYVNRILFAVLVKKFTNIFYFILNFALICLNGARSSKPLNTKH
jgi:hypothetical protein